MKGNTTFASRLRHRLTLQQPQLVTDGGGGYTKSWQTVADIWGEIRAGAGHEVFQANQNHAQTTHRLFIRRRSDITSSMRFLYEGRVLNIHAIITPIDTGDGLQEIIIEEGGEL